MLHSLAFFWTDFNNVRITNLKEFSISFLARDHIIKMLMRYILLFQPVQPFLQTGNQAILVQHFHDFYPLFQFGGNEQICQILHIVQHLAGFHKPVIQNIFRCLGCVLHLPAFQKMQIIAQHPQAAHFLLPVCFQQRTLRFGEGSCRRGLVRGNPKILCQLLRCFVTAQVK